VTVVVGVLFSAILIIHTFATENAVEKNSIDLKTALEKYYSKEAAVQAAQGEG
jgi:hypothetical protein